MAEMITPEEHSEEVEDNIRSLNKTQSLSLAAIYTLRVAVNFFLSVAKDEPDYPGKRAKKEEE